MATHQHVELASDEGNRAFQAWRARHGLSLSAAAEALALSRRMVAYYCSGDKTVPRHILLACAGWEAARQRARTAPSPTEALDSHDITERSKLLAHQYYALRIREAPEYLAKAHDLIRSAVRHGVATPGHELWDQALALDRDAMIEIMLEETERGRLMRSNSPFSRLIGIRDPKARSELWRQAKRDLSARTT